MKNFKHLPFLSILCSLVLFSDCGDDESLCICYIYENGVQTRIDESESGGSCQSESYFIDEDNYSVCQFSSGNGPRGF